MEIANNNNLCRKEFDPLNSRLWPGVVGRKVSEDWIVGWWPTGLWTTEKMDVTTWAQNQISSEIDFTGWRLVKKYWAFQFLLIFSANLEMICTKILLMFTIKWSKFS